MQSCCPVNGAAVPYGSYAVITVRGPVACAGGCGSPLPTHMSWDLMHWCPEASAAALDESPVAVIWHFQLGAADAE